MKEDLSISRVNVEKTLAENKRLRLELEKFRKVDKKCESKVDLQPHPAEKRLSVVQVSQKNINGKGNKKSPKSDKYYKYSIFQTSYEAGLKEVSSEFRMRLQEELIQREEVEKQLEKQVSFVWK